MTRVRAQLLIPGDGDPVPKAELLYYNSNGTIYSVGPQFNAKAPTNVTNEISVPVLMPGLFDAHTHFVGTMCAKNPDHNKAVLGSLNIGWSPKKYENFACAVAQLKEALCAGVTSVREVGGPYGQALSHIEQSGLIAAPHFHYANRALGITGGHTDQQYLPVGITHHDHADDAYEYFGALCDGVAECLRKVREQIRSQADVVKIMTTGGVLTAFDQPTNQEFSLAEARAIVEEATRSQRAVAAHAHGAPGIKLAIDSGVSTIEHGSYMNSTLAREAAALRMVHIPTITIQQSFNRSARPPEYDALQWAKGQEVLRHHTAAVRESIKAGVTMATGTDCPGSCALVSMELVYLVELFGLSPLEAIKRGTANGPLTLAVRQEDHGLVPKTGVLSPGFAADMIGLQASPLDNVRLLTDPDEVTHVWKAGRQVKGPEYPLNAMCTGVATAERVHIEQWVPEHPCWMD